MDYQVEADWKMLDGCNFRCGYCFWSPESLGSKISGLPSAEEWAAAFDGTGKSWLLHMTGGEPSLYPDFPRLAERLAERHCLSVNSNFSHPNIADMARRVSPDRVSLLHAALHPEERNRRKTWDAFAANLEAVAAAGHRIILSVVATPDVIERFEDIARQCEGLGFRPVPKMVRGAWQGRNYPFAYTPSERVAFRKAHAWAREGYASLLADEGERPTVWPLDDDESIDLSLDYRGSTCDAGRIFVSIHPDGSTFRCGTDGYLGNVLKGDLRLNTKPIRCATSYCPYFCRKYSYRPYFSFAGSVGHQHHLEGA